MKNLYSCLIALLLSTSAITVNAATATLNPTADALVQAGANASNNYGTLTSLRMRTSTTVASNYDSYLKFDTSSVVGSISNVKLRLYAALSASGTLTTTAFAVPTTTWTETGITWNNKPARGASLGSVAITSTAYAYREIDVTAYVQSEYAAGRKVVSFAYHNAANTSIYITANSKEATNKPQLLITYSTNTPPTISLSSQASSYVAPASITLNASAADIDGNATITKVEFFNGATLLNTATTAPYSYTWSNVPAGSYTLTAKATDNANASTTSAAINITVTANTPPSVSLLAPSATDDFTAPATFSLVANASDSDGIAKVEFYNGTSLLGTSTQSPYQYDWSNVPAGNYSLTAKAYDNATASATSSAVSIVVKAAPAPPGIYYIYADHLNTPRVITDSANTTVWSWNSDPFGTDVAQEDVDGDGRKFSYNLRFPGQYYDRETSLHYNYFRDYDPGTGRYTQSDPIGLAGGSFSTYAYVLGNPISFIDPLGLVTRNDIDAAQEVLKKAYPKEFPKSPSSVSVEDLEEKGTAYTDGKNGIHINSRVYGDCKIETDNSDFLQTMAHEMLHVNEPLYERKASEFFRAGNPLGYFHRKLNEKATRLADPLWPEFLKRRNELNAQSKNKQCGCP